MQVFPIEFEPPGRPRVCFSPDGRWLGLTLARTPLIDSHDGSAHPTVWRGAVTALAFVPGREAAISVNGNEFAFIYFETGGRGIDYLKGQSQDVVVTPDGRSAFVAGRVNDLTSTLTTVRLTDEKILPPREIPHDVRRLALSADGKWLVTVDGRYPRVWLLDGDALPEKELHRIDTKTGVEDLALSHDGAQLALATTRGVRVHETATGKELFRSGLHRMTVTSVAFAPDRLLMATGGVDGKVFFWENGRVVKRLEWGLDHAVSVAFAPDGLRCAACDYKQVVVWDVDE